MSESVTDLSSWPVWVQRVIMIGAVVGVFTTIGGLGLSTYHNLEQRIILSEQLRNKSATNDQHFASIDSQVSANKQAVRDLQDDRLKATVAFENISKQLDRINNKLDNLPQK
jgi:hypothetical protein